MAQIRETPTSQSRDLGTRRRLSGASGCGARPDCGQAYSSRLCGGVACVRGLPVHRNVHIFEQSTVLGEHRKCNFAVTGSPRGYNRRD